MADKKITQLTNITGANLVDADEFVVVDISADETKAITLGELKEAFDSGSGFVRITGDTMTGDLALSGADVTFGDNDKAIFGAGSDLQIYHDGSNSRIQDTATGSLILAGTNFYVNNTGDSKSYLAGLDGGSTPYVRLYYDGATRLDTTSTGVDIKNVASGANAKLNITTESTGGGTSEILFSDNTIGRGRIYYDHGSSPEELHIETTGTDAIVIDNSQNVTIPNGNLDITGTLTSDGLTVDQTSGYVLLQDLNAAVVSGTDMGGVKWRTGDSTVSGSNRITAAIRAEGDGTFNAVDKAPTKLVFSTHGNSGADPVDRMTIDSSGNVGIGTDSPQLGSAWNKVLHIHSSSGSGSHIRMTDPTSGETGESGLYIGQYGVDSYFINRESGKMLFVNNGSEAMRITSAGRLGVNTTSPATELDVQGTTTTNGLNLDAISETITDTAVDVFVYDTSKDSDGGAWRKRTQGTSWYNETLNTSTRGSRKEFPSVAVIVAEAGTVTIYDGDDPDLPMWMVFDVNPYDLLNPNGASSGYVTSVAALNGLVTISKNVNYGSVPQISFIEDTGYFYHSVVGTYKYNGNIHQRNDAIGAVSINSNTIVNPYTKDVAMTVLPNAPIDAATGLPVPTIAVATDGGVSVIKDDGTVVDFAQSVAGGPISIGEDGIVYVGRTTLSTCVIYGFNMPSADISTQDYYYADSQVPKIGGAVSGGVIQDVVRTGDASLSYAYNNHFGNISEVREELTRGMISKVTSTYNTGWQNGDIKLATLSDTDDTDVTGSNLVSGDAASDDTNSVGNWSGQSGATTTVNSNASYVYSGVYSIRIAGSGSSAGAKYYNAGILTSGKTYTLTFAVNSADGDGVQWVAGSSNGGSDYGGNSGIISASNTWYIQTLTFTATTSDLSITVFEQGGSNSPDIYVDDISVRLAEEDRSVNGNGLQVFGTITKTAVASGADLVAYSGFSTSNYLYQPYNSDLDFGTGDFCVMGWFRLNSGLVSQALMYRKTTLDNTRNGYGLDIDGSSRLRFHTRSGSNTDLFSTGSVADGTWKQVVAYRQNGSMYMFLNGVLNTNSTGTVRNLDNSTANLTIGFDQVSGSFALTGGSLALWRISATAPSPEQIAKIYEDEKVLFQENAQATLYGSSDAVTALAYDDTTELLHAGTSAGRSVFQGLRRVDNTTDAVGAAISASNGLVAED